VLIPAAAERRQVTVVFVDVIGSSRLAQALDPEDFSDLIVAYRRAATTAIEAHRGFVARFVGDGILAYWGYPRAREQDPKRAVAAGLAIIAAISDLNRQPLIAGIQLGVRIAIDSGIVVVGQLGETAGGADDILGEAPNIAARLQQLADPNTVLVTETVRQLVEWQFHFAQHGEVELKGFSAPVRVYRVTAERHNSRHGRPIRSERIYDREIEQGMLDRCWRAIVAGRGQTILISGEPGIGKTALVDYLRRTVTASGGMCVLTSCFPEGIHSPLLPIRDLMRQAIGIALLDELSTLRTKLDVIATRDRLDCDSVNQILLPLLDPGSSEMTFTGLAASERKRRSDFVINWLRSIADRSPFLIIVEDVHWADTTSLEFLDLLMAQVAGTRLCLVLTWRTGFQSGWIDRANVTWILLTRLKDEVIDSLVSGMVGHDVADVALRQAITAKAEGNPLFAEELALLANQTRAENRSVDVLTLPSSLNDSLLARLDDLGELKRIAQVAAVIGREFDDMVLARVLDIPRGVLAPMLESLIASGIVVDFGGGLGTSHGFKHALVRDAAYNSLLKARRRAIHTKTAATLAVEYPRVAEANPELVAQHYEEAALFGEAITWWTKAGDQASRHSTTVDSIRLLERARALFARLRGENQLVREAEVLNLLGVQYIAAHGYASPLVEQAFGEAVEILGGGRDEAPGTLFFALWGLHIHAMVRGDVPRAIENGIRMLGLAEAEGDSDKILQAHRLQGLARLLMGAHGEATHHYLEVLKAYDPILHESHRFRYGSDPAVLALAQLAWGEWIGGRIALSQRHASEAVAYARQLGHAHSVAYAVGVNALRLLTAREFAASAEAATEVRNLAEKHGFPYWVAWCDTILAALERSTDPIRGCALLTAAIEQYQQTGARQLVPYARALEAECWLDADRPMEARTALDAGLAVVEETGVRLYQAELLRLRACTAYRLDESTGDSHLGASLELARKQAAGSFVLRGLVTRFEKAAAEGTRNVARRDLMKVLLTMAEQPETADMLAARELLAQPDAQQR
jgi:class 3 adenylate cyclase